MFANILNEEMDERMEDISILIEQKYQHLMTPMASSQNNCFRRFPKSTFPKILKIRS